jgi:hypothetical protein
VRFFRFLFTLFAVYVVVVLGIGAVLFFAPDVWSPPVLRQIEKISQSKFGVEFKADKLKWVGLWPVVLRMENPRFDLPKTGLKGTAEAVNLRFSVSRIDQNWARPRVEIGVQLAAPLIERAAPKKTAAPAQKPSDAAKAPGPLPLVRPAGADVALWLEIIDGRLKAHVDGGDSKPIIVDKIQFKANLPSARDEVWHPSVSFKARIGTKFNETQITQPVALELPNIELGQDRVKVQKGTIKAAELPFGVDGFYDFTDGTLKWNIGMGTVDIAKIPVSFLPPGEWKGTFTGAFNLEKEISAPLKITGQLQTEGLSGQVKFKNESVAIDGPVSAQGGLRFAYSERLRLDDFSVAADLKNTVIEALPHFKKAAGTDLYVDLVADGDGDNVFLRRASVLLAQLKVLGSGQLGLGEGGAIKAAFTWPSTTLTGLEKIILPLSQAPLQGQVAGNVEVSGSWRDLNGLAVHLKSLRLTNMVGRLNWTGADGLKVAGPIGLNGMVSALVKGTEVRSAAVDAGFDLTHLGLSGHQTVQKAAGLPLRAQIAAGIKGKAVQLTHLKMAGNTGDIVVSGTAQMDKMKIPMKFRLLMAKAHIENWMKFLVTPPVQMTGEISGGIEISGQYNFEEALAASPLKARGQVTLRQGTVVIRPPPAAASGAKAEPVAEAPAPMEPLLPNWPLIRSSDVSLDVSMPSVVYGDLKVQGVQSKLRLMNGQVGGTLSVAEVFGGSLQAQKIVVSPLVGPPGLELQALVKGIQMGGLLAWFSPKLKGYMKGFANGKLGMIGPIPSGMGALKDVSANGELAIFNGQFLTWELQKKINDRLQKVGLGKKGVKNKDIVFKADTKFTLSDGSTQIKDLGLLTEDRDELRLRGTVGLDMSLDLAGTAFVASQRIGGAVAAANSDASGRLAVPLQIRGSVMDPEFLFAEATLKSMLAKAGEAEAKKALAKAEDKLKAEAAKQLGKNKDKLKDDVKKKLKGLFGK